VEATFESFWSFKMTKLWFFGKEQLFLGQKVLFASSRDGILQFVLNQLKNHPLARDGFLTKLS